MQDLGREIKTNNYHIKYLDINNDNNIFMIELYRAELYRRLVKKLKKIFNNYCKINNVVLKLNFYNDLMSIIIINNNNNNSPIFNNLPIFDKEILNDYFIKNHCIVGNKVDIDVAVIILSLMTPYYIKYYKLLRKKKKKLMKFPYKIYHEDNNGFIKILIDIDDESLKNIPVNLRYDKYITLPSHIFNHLLKLYNNKVYNIHDGLNADNENKTNLKIDDKFLEYVYMVFQRYVTLSNGNNQASILPSFKLLLKTKLNIKIELFGSALNTSASNFGSIFYDIEWVFGSIGNFFDAQILRGYYEVNPPFDHCLIKKMIKKTHEQLLLAEESKEPLLFMYIIPSSFFRNTSNDFPKSKFMKFDTYLKKDNFPYIRYNREFTNTVVSGIVDTRITILHTNYINNYVLRSVNDFNETLKLWINKNKK